MDKVSKIGDMLFFTLYLRSYINICMEHDMNNNNVLKLGMSLVLSVSLSACSYWGSRTDYVDSHYEPVNQKQMPVNKPKTVAVQKSYASKDPTQKSTPGPTRKAAAKIPVM